MSYIPPQGIGVPVAVPRIFEEHIPLQVVLDALDYLRSQNEDVVHTPTLMPDGRILLHVSDYAITYYKLYLLGPNGIEASTSTSLTTSDVYLSPSGTWFNELGTFYHVDNTLTIRQSSIPGAPDTDMNTTFISIYSGVGVGFLYNLSRGGNVYYILCIGATCTIYENGVDTGIPADQLFGVDQNIGIAIDRGNSWTELPSKVTNPFPPPHYTITGNASMSLRLYGGTYYPLFYGSKSTIDIDPNNMIVLIRANGNLYSIPFDYIRIDLDDGYLYIQKWMIVYRVAL